MISKTELERAIAEVESSAETYEDCAKLATFYEIQDHLYAHDAPQVMSGDSEFMRMVSDKDAAEVWGILDELMDTLIIYL